MYYLVTYDNGEEYEQNEQKPIAIFDSFNRAKNFAISKGFKSFEGSLDVYFREVDEGHAWLKHKDFIYIEEFEMNEPKEYI